MATKAKSEKVIKKGKNWKLTQVTASGNYVVYFQGKEYVYHENLKKYALMQIESIKKVSRVSKKRAKK